MRMNWLYRRWVAIVVGLIVGGAVGLAVYEGSRLSGAGLYVLCGTAAGGIAALVFYGYTRAVHLTEMKVSIPHVSDFTFAVTQNKEVVAWRLFVECATRISTQPLEEGTGLVREALNSLYTLFTTIRTVLADTEPSRRAGGKPTVEHLAIAMLNNEMRPFMSKWHARLSKWEKENPGVAEANWPEDAECRAALEEMRKHLLEYVRAMGKLAGIDDVNVMLTSPQIDASGKLIPRPAHSAG
jgi:hypothetical protein